MKLFIFKGHFAICFADGGIQITDEVSKEWMKKQIDFSNSKGAKNPIKYPIQRTGDPNGTLGMCPLYL